MRYVIIFWYRLICCIKVSAQDNYVISHLDNTNGLSNNSVMGVFQDSDKLLWLNTWDGLDLYNGISFNSFKSNEVQSSSHLPNKVVTKVREDKLHRIWICTEEGITRYNKADGSMNHYFYNNGKVNGKSADYFLTISSNNDIVCGLRFDSTLYSYDYDRNRMVPLKYKQKSPGRVAKAEFDESGRLWTLSFGGILRVYEKRGDLYYFLKRFDNPINIFYIVNHRLFFAEQDTQLFEITKGLKVKRIMAINHAVQDIQYFMGHYFLVWLYKGVQEFDENFAPVDQLAQSFPALHTLQVNSLTETDGTTLWIATRDQGIFKIKKRTEVFAIPKDSPDKLIGGSNVQAIQKVGAELWMATLNNGILRIPYDDKASLSITSIRPVPSAFDSDNSYYALSEGYDGKLYVGSDAKGITIYDPVSKKFTPWPVVKNAPFDEDFFRVRTILTQKDSSFFAGYNGGVYHGKIKQQVNGDFRLEYLRSIKVAGHFLKPGNNLVYALAQMDNWILIGYRFAGLSLLNKQTGKTVNIVANAYKGGLLTNNIASLLVDSRQRIWIGTSYGLFWINGKDILQTKPVFHQINVRNGLPNNNVHAIVEDNSGNIWASTNQGLAKINTQTLSVVQYGVEDGLQNAEFSDNAVFKNTDGILYFGGIAGLNYFDPSKISVDKQLSNLLITDLNIAGKTSDGVQLMVIKPHDKYLPKNIQLLRNENYFSLKVQPSDGYTNKKFRYRYYLKNYDAKWHETTQSSNIDYSSLPPGQYSFLVKWSNGQGEWTAERKVFDMEIHQYFWLTGIAKAIYCLVIVICGYLFFRIRKSRMEIKHKLAMENLIRVNEQKLYRQKMDFFTNITHELQTPLTLILGSIERFLFKNKNNEARHAGWNFLDIANQEAFRLQYLTHRLLEFRKAEDGHLKAQLTSFNLSNLLSGIAALFEPLTEQNSIQTTVSITENIRVTSDKDKIEMIVFNLLSNAFKYTRPGESIDFLVTETAAESVNIVVANTGYNGPSEGLHLLFEQFYTLDNNDRSKASSGIGLAFARQLTELLGGSIAVVSKEQRIAFNVTLPLIVPVSPRSRLTNIKASEKPSELVRSAISSQSITENKVTVNNDLALVEDLSNSAKRTILIVEDEPSIRLLLREILAEKYIVYEAENGRSALDLLKRIIPSLIVSDVLMDELDGLKLCAAIKNTFETCHIPFVLLSALSSAEERVEGFEVGADAYLAKPFNATILLNKIDQLIQYREKIQSFFKKDGYVQPAIESGLKSDDKLFLEKVIKVINENLSSPDLDAPFLEKAMGMSKMSLYRKVKAFTNMTPAELIKHVRLKTAASLLRSTQLTVSEIYYQTGLIISLISTANLNAYTPFLPKSSGNRTIRQSWRISNRRLHSPLFIPINFRAFCFICL
ncbi:MAG: response regulator [Mucilaginibacter sp.]|nr:response regulator [Mucilaginibacter sp.]